MNASNVVSLASLNLDNTRAILRDKRSALLAELRRHMHEVLRAQEDGLPVQADTERATEALEEADLALHLSELSIAADELRAVNDALAAIKAGNYGYCVSCGEPINPARLAAIPVALECLECASRRESSH